MLYPSIDDLLSRIDSKYKLVALASKRARELSDHNNKSYVGHPASKKNVGVALEEIVHDTISIRIGEEEQQEQDAE